MSILGYFTFGFGCHQTDCRCAPQDVCKIMADKNPKLLQSENGGDWCFATQDETAENDRVVVAFSGMLTNRDELCSMAGVRPNLSSAEICAALAKAFPGDVAKRLRGAYWALIIEKATRKLTLIRDAFGQMPMAYSIVGGNSLVFSDSLDLLRRFPGVSDRISTKAVMDYLALGYVPAPQSIYSDILKVMPASRLEISAVSDSSSMIRYWRPSFAPVPNNMKFRDAVAVAHELMTASLKRVFALRPNMSLMLSGGLDSNVMLALANAAGLPFREAVTVGYKESPLYDERAMAGISAGHFGTRHRCGEVASSVISERLGEFQKLCGEPYADSSLLATQPAVALAAAGGCSCVMTGSGGDEFFGGYRRYRAVQIGDTLACVMPRPLLRLMAGILGGNGAGPLENRASGSSFRRMMHFLASKPLAGYASFQQMVSSDLRRELVKDEEMLAQRDFLQDWADKVACGTAVSPVEQVNELDFHEYLPNDGCMKEYLAGLSAGCATTAPIMDVEIAEFAFGLPRSWRVTCCSTKRIMREIAGRYLPQEFLKPAKKGFGVPLHQWLRGDAANVIRELAVSCREWDVHGWFDPAVLERCVNEHLAGTHNHVTTLYAILCLKEWLGTLN